MQEFLENLNSSQWFATFVSFLTANFGVLLTLVISVIKLRIKNIDKDKVIEECMKHTDEVIAEKIGKVIEDNQQAMVDKMDRLETKVVSKIGATEDERARLIQAQSLELTSKLDALKAEYTVEETKTE